MRDILIQTTELVLKNKELKRKFIESGMTWEMYSKLRGLSK